MHLKNSPRLRATFETSRSSKYYFPRIIRDPVYSPHSCIIVLSFSARDKDTMKRRTREWPREQKKAYEILLEKRARHLSYTHAPLVVTWPLSLRLNMWIMNEFASFSNCFHQFVELSNKKSIYKQKKKVKWRKKSPHGCFFIYLSIFLPLLVASDTCTRIANSEINDSTAILLPRVLSNATLSPLPPSPPPVVQFVSFRSLLLTLTRHARTCVHGFTFSCGDVRWCVNQK